MPDAAAAGKATAVPAKTQQQQPNGKAVTAPTRPAAAPPVDPWQRVFNILGLVGFVLALLSNMPVKDASTALINSLAALKPSPATPHPSSSASPVFADDESAYEHSCPPHQYDSVKIVSRNPDIIIVEGFLSPFERKYLVDIAYQLPLSPLSYSPLQTGPLVPNCLPPCAA